MYPLQKIPLTTINTHCAKNILSLVCPLSSTDNVNLLHLSGRGSDLLQYSNISTRINIIKETHVWKPWTFRILHDTPFHNILYCVMRILVLKINRKIIFVAKNLVMYNLIYKVSHSITPSEPSTVEVGGLWNASVCIQVKLKQDSTITINNWKLM